MFLLDVLLQAAIRPPTFVFFVNDAKLFPETYRRYMEKKLRSDAGFSGTPIRLLWRSKRKMGKDEGQYLFEVLVTSILLLLCILLFGLVVGPSPQQSLMMYITMYI